MTMPQKTLGLSIVLAFLCVHHCTSNDVNATTENPHKQYGNNNNKYDIIDQTQRSGVSSKTRTGETTHIFTTGEVDDDFWLKHLGEDFKHAIHLQVGGNDQLIGNYSNPQNVPTFEVHHEYLSGPGNPVQMGNKIMMDYPRQTQIEGNKHNTREIKMEEKTEKPEEKHEDDKSKMTANQNNTTENHDSEYKQSFKIDAGINYANNYYNPSSFDLLNQNQNTNTDANANQYMQYTKTEYTQTKRALTHQENKNTYDTQDDSKLGKSPYSQVVVNLPETQNTVHHLDGTELPVVVKMPPVIYHQNFKYTQDDTVIPTQTQTHSQSHSHTEQQTQTAQPLEYSPYAGSYYPALSYRDPPNYNAPNVYQPSLSENKNAADSLMEVRYVITRPASNRPKQTETPPPDSAIESYSRVSRASPYRYIQRFR